MTRIKIIIFTVILLLLAGIFFNRVSIKEYVLNWQKPELPEGREFVETRHPERSDPPDSLREALRAGAKPRDITSLDPSTPSSQGSSVAQDDGLALPLEYNLAVPFQSQAPRANWDMPYQEACEEASLIMADAFYNKKSLTVAEMDERIKKLVDWEVKRFGYYEDTTAAEVATVAREYFGLKAELDYDVSVDKIKKYVSQNKLVLVPAAGKTLPNPNFRNGGPLYHMLVIRGYTPDKFITNDPGTRKGKEFVYKYDDLINAVHDWPAAAKAMAGVPPQEKGGYTGLITEADILTGEKVLIVVDK